MYVIFCIFLLCFQLNFLIRKIKEWEFQKNYCRFLPYFYTYPAHNDPSESMFFFIQTLQEGNHCLQMNRPSLLHLRFFKRVICHFKSVSLCCGPNSSIELLSCTQEIFVCHSVFTH